MSHYCIKCKNNISDAEYSYSMRFFKKPLCRKDQPTGEVRKPGNQFKKTGILNISKKRFELLMIVFCLVVIVGLLFVAEFSKSAFIKVPVFGSIWMLTKYVWEFFWGFVKMFWTLFTSSWLSVAAIVIIIIFFLLEVYYKKHYK